ncbi:MAG: hydrogenase expression protein, partial [Actinoallomurus sp.]|nr:hydrogenase expression protein [Actinoallomurus sp.]
PGTGTVDRGTHVSENLCYPGRGDNQMWYLDKRSSHRFWIRNNYIHKWCLDVLGVDGAGGKDSALTVVQCDPKDDHLWSFS